jgi:hypothetical protein
MVYLSESKKSSTTQQSSIPEKSPEVVILERPKVKSIPPKLLTKIEKRKKTIQIKAEISRCKNLNYQSSDQSRMSFESTQVYDALNMTLKSDEV